MSDLLKCACGNDTWFVCDNSLQCLTCGKIKGVVIINNQPEVIKSMGIPPSLPNALELAKAQLDRLTKNEQILDRIKNLIDQE